MDARQEALSRNSRRAPQPMNRGPQRAPVTRWGFRGAEDLGAADSALTIYGLVPMAAVVVAGLWMALH